MGTPPTPALTPRRPYDGSLRRARAAATRLTIAAAARALFVANGWAGTTMRAVAAAAGVAEPTVYKAYGNKAGLAVALLDAIESEADAEALHAQLAAGQGDPTRQLTALIEFDCRLFERSGDLIALLIDAGRSEPDLQRAYAHGRQNGDRLRHEVFTNWAPGALGSDLMPEAAVDTYAAVCNIHTYAILRDERGYDPARIKAWWIRTLSRLLLGDG